MSASQLLTLDFVEESLAGKGAAFRAVTDYQPAGGAGDKVFPATYEGGKYATESRHIDGEKVPCVLVDSVASQANRMELALLEAWRDGEIPLPVVTVDFTGYDLPKPFRVTSLEAPHRIADALLRDAQVDGTPFRKSGIGRRIDAVEPRHATPLFEICPTALVFGMWDSTGEKGGLGAKFQRSLVSEIVGHHATPGVAASSRIDPAQVQLKAGTVYESKQGGWTLDPQEARQSKGNPVSFGKQGKPSELNHGNVTPSIEQGGFTVSKAVQTTVLSLAALRRLRFPDADGVIDPEVDRKARTALAAMALFAGTRVREDGCDLRSRCQLHATSPPGWQFLGRPGDAPLDIESDSDTAAQVYSEAVAAARAAGLPWMDEELVMKPSGQLLELVRRSQQLAAEHGEEGGA